MLLIQPLYRESLEVNIYIPDQALREYVLNISTVKACLPESAGEAVTPYPPTPFQSLFFYCNDPIYMSKSGHAAFEKQPATILTGPQFSRVNIKVVGRLYAIRVDFMPGALHRFLGIPMTELFDGGFDAADFWGSELRSLHEQIQQEQDIKAAKNLVEKFLINKAAALHSVLPFHEAMKDMLRKQGNIRIEDSASIACMGLRQFERKCKEIIGMGPKTYARILRFSKAYRLHEAFPGLSWTKIAYEAGYYDQMHLIRDFKLFAGVNPTIIEQELQHTPLRMQKDFRIYEA